jgi:hypothetical protein
MSYEQFGNTAFAGPESGPQPLLPHALADHEVMYSGGLWLTMSQIDKDASGRLGLRTDQPGNPALFRVGQLVTIERGDDSTKPQYMGEDTKLRDLTTDETGALPPLVQNRLNWLQEVHEQAKRDQEANQHLQGEVLSEETLTPLQHIARNLARTLLKAVTFGSHARKSRHSPRPHSNAHNTHPADTRPAGRHRAQDTTGPGRRRAASGAGRHRAEA